MTVWDELHKLVDTLPAAVAQAVLEYARWQVVHEGEDLTAAERHGGRVPSVEHEHSQSLKELVDELLGDGETPEAADESVTTS